MEFVTKLHPELDLKVFLCSSWLLAPELKELLKPESNILHFQNRFTKFTMGAHGIAPFSFVFNQSVKSLDTLDVDALQEDTSLQRNIKEYYRKGKAIHETSGLILLKRQ